MGVGINFEKIDIGGIFSGIGKLFGDIRTAITGEEALTSEARAALEGLLGNLEQGLLQLQNVVVEAQKSVIVAEAQGESWLQRNWRPVAMMTFLVIIVYQAVFVSIFELPPVNMEAIPDKMWELLKIGIGGYIAGRSLEKAVKYYRKGGE